jgi:hypothetical protein
MANHDVRIDITPQNAFRRAKGPTITALRAALTAHSGVSYPSHRLDTMTDNDMVYAARVHGLTVAGLT